MSRKQHSNQFKLDAINYRKEHPDLSQAECAKKLGLLQPEIPILLTNSTIFLMSSLTLSALTLFGVPTSLIFGRKMALFP